MARRVRHGGRLATWHRDCSCQGMFADLHQLSHHHAWRRQLEMLLESTGEGIYGIDLRGRCIFINQAGADLLGYSPDEVLGRNMHYLIHHTRTDGDAYAVHECRIFRAFQEGLGVRCDDEMLWRRDGSGFAAEYASYPIRDKGAVVGAVVTFNDITDRKRAELALHAAHAELERRVVQRTAELSSANEELRQSHIALQRLSSHLHAVREAERAHIARDIHDELGSSLTALQLDLNWLRKRTADAALGARVDDMLAVAGSAMRSVRRLLTDLRPGVLDHLGLWAALEWLLQDFEARTGVTAHYQGAATLDTCRLGHEAEIALYRIAQEVLTNVARHAQAHTLSLSVRADGRAVELQFHDDGLGMRVPAQPTSFGLLGMHERARALGWQLRLDSAPGAGTTVRVRLPEVLTGSDAP
ncbi:MAG: PAS domain-containing sensor histidine kinase [Rhodocyclaceae bacterium]